MTAPQSQDCIDSYTTRLLIGCGDLYVTLGPESKPVKIWIRSGKQGECRNTLHRAISGLIRLCIKRGASWDEIKKDLAGNICNQGSGSYPPCLVRISEILPVKEVKP